MANRGDARLHGREGAHFIEITLSDAHGAAQPLAAFAYDPAGAETARYFPGGAGVQQTRDANGNVVRASVVGAVHAGARPGQRWDGDDLIEETVERRATDVAAETPFTLVERRRYAYSPHSETPIAQAIDSESSAGAWRYFLHREGAPIPLALVRADGTVEEAFETEAYGRVIAGDAAATRSRFAGHWCDQETGLHYNRWRYFDPATGTYLSPEPLGLLGGLESYGYASGRPLALVDRDGLACDTTITGANGQVLATGRSSGATRPEDLHPAVAAALPVANARNGANPIAPTSCSEPVALSNYLNDWQRRTGQTCDPGTPQGRKELNGALSQMKGISSNVGAAPMAACPNCSQTISRLFQLADPPAPMPTVGAGQATGSTTIVPGGLQNPQGAALVPSRKGGMNDLPSSALATNTNPATAANPALMAAANQDAYNRAGGTGSVAGLTPGVFNDSSGTWGRVL